MLPTMSSITASDCTPEEWQVRVDLAAAHRLAVMNGFHEAIFNHLTVLVPGKVGQYYQIPYGLHWSEVKASSFMEVTFDGEVKRGSGKVERTGYCIHAPIHRDLPHAKAVFHAHMPFSGALTRLEDPRLKEIGQTELSLIDLTVYDNSYNGLVFDPEEGARLAKLIGNKFILFMASHGVTTVGRSVAEAFHLLYFVERAAQVQIYAMWTGQKLRWLPEAVVTKTKNDYSKGNFYLDLSPVEQHFEALKRILDRKEPDYKD